MFVETHHYPQPSYHEELQSTIINLHNQALNNPKNKEGISDNSRTSKNKKFWVTSTPDTFTLRKYPPPLSGKDGITLKKEQDVLSLSIPQETLKKEHVYEHIVGADYDKKGKLFIIQIGPDTVPSNEVKKIITKLIKQASEAF